jgi:hypothetical protein
MPLLEIPQVGHKVTASVTLEQSTAELTDRYAAYSKATADQVVEQALQYVFQKDKEFQQYTESNKGQAPPPSLRIAGKPGRKEPKAATTAKA